eukprot:2706557-Prymnesium_polylepis.1
MPHTSRTITTYTCVTSVTLLSRRLLRQYVSTLVPLVSTGRSLEASRLGQTRGCPTAMDLFDSDTGERIDTGAGLQGEIYKRLTNRRMKDYEESHIKPYFKPLCKDYQPAFPAAREERYEQAAALKTSGNAAYKRKDFREARV